MKLYHVTVTVTHEADVRAASMKQAREIAESLNGRHPFDITDITITAAALAADDGASSRPAATVAGGNQGE